MKKWLSPIISTISLVLMYLVVGGFISWKNPNDVGYGGLVFFLYIMVFIVLVVVPILCFSYAKRCLKNQRYRFLFTIYNSLCIVLPYLLLFIREDETIIYSLIFFGWCELWSLIGLSKAKDRNQEENIGFLNIKYKGKSNDRKDSESNG
ncbi:MAG: hypothetical protein E7614_05070 [Ruminococcaceae bacterium]|nr:hypothetical protein [Oscillospiraceae bacterium]